jgi:hypothetical protein
MRMQVITDLYLHPPFEDDPNKIHDWNRRRIEAEAAMGELWVMPCRSGKTMTALSALYHWSGWLGEWGVPLALRRVWQYPHLVLAPSDMVRDGVWDTDWAKVCPPWDGRANTWKEGGSWTPDTFPGGIWLVPTMPEADIRYTLSKAKADDIVVMTYHTLRHREAIVSARDWGMIVADEVHMIKNPRAGWTESAYMLKSLARLGLSATPFTNYVHDLREVLAWLQGWTYQGRRISAIWPASNVWQDRHCAYEYRPPKQGMGAWAKIPAGAQNPAHLYHWLRSEVMFSVTPEEVSDAPEPIIKPMPIPLSDSQQEVYRQLEKGIVSWADKQGTVNNLVVRAKMMLMFELCADARQLEVSLRNQAQYGLSSDFARGWTLDDKSSKMKLVRWLLETVAPKEQLLILTGYSHLSDIVVADLVKLGYRAVSLTGDTKQKDRGKIIQDYESGKIQIVACTRAAWQGISLAAPNVILFGFVDWTPGMVKQAMRRAWTMNDTKPVTVWDAYAPGTVEEWNRNRLAAKDSYSTVMTNGREDVLFVSPQDLRAALRGGNDGEH